MMNRDQFTAALGSILLDARHHQIINAHAIGQTDPLVFQRHVVVVVVAAEHGFTAQLPRPIKQTAWILGAANFVDHLFPVLSKEPGDLAASCFVQLIGGTVLLQRNMKEYHGWNIMPGLSVHALNFSGIPAHLIVVDKVVDVNPLTGIGIGVNKEQPGVQTAVGIAQFNELVVSTGDVRLGIWIKQSTGGLVGK